VLTQVRLAVTDRSEVGAARRMAMELSGSIGLDETQAGKVGLCVTEAATNIIKHAGSGQIVLRALEADGAAGLEILALDRGPGIANLQASLRDGVSTAGSCGTGLGALARLSNVFDAYAPLGRGSAMRMEIWSRPPRASTEIQLGAVCLAKTGETIPGDGWGVESAGGRHTILVADGLGHGPEAAKAAYAALRVLRSRPEEEPGQIIDACHRALAATRGAAVAVCRIAPGRGAGSFAGVGNISARVEAGEARRQLASHNGTVGHNVRRVQQFEFPWARDALLILHSDGLATRWNLSEYPGLASRHPGLIAGVLYRDHERGRDDVTVLVVRSGAGAWT
jgi:anti-sigma regulatory factor (Ser/Thr protein kinase)